MNETAKTIRPYQAATIFGEAILMVEQAYEATQGECTAYTDAVESFAALKRSEALEALARFVRYCESGMTAIKAERERLAVAEERIAKPLEWACKELDRLLGDEKSVTAGPFRIKTRVGAKVVDVAPDVEPQTLPPHLVRWSDPQESVASIDKRAAKEYLEDPRNPPIPGLSLRQKPRSVKVE